MGWPSYDAISYGILWGGGGARTERPRCAPCVHTIAALSLVVPEPHASWWMVGVYLYTHLTVRLIAAAMAPFSDSFAAEAKPEGVGSTSIYSWCVTAWTGTPRFLQPSSQLAIHAS
jgi:hypothetical protein